MTNDFIRHSALVDDINHAVIPRISIQVFYQMSIVNACFMTTLTNSVVVLTQVVGKIMENIIKYD